MELIIVVLFWGNFTNSPGTHIKKSIIEKYDSDYDDQDYSRCDYDSRSDVYDYDYYCDEHYWY